MNNKAANHFLINLLSKELGALIKKKTQDNDTFVIVWMLILQLIQLTSIEVFEGIKSCIKVHHPLQYSGKNLAKLGEHFIDDANHLHSILGVWQVQDGVQPYLYQLGDPS